jgi:succinyl-diaminopimelate desuccinylase
MPDLGHNAVMMMVALLSELDRLPIPYTDDPLLGGFSRSINTINGGVKTNVVPDECTATVDMRTVPGQDHRAVQRQVEELIAGMAQQSPHFRASLTVLNDRPPILTSPDLPIVRTFADIMVEVTGREPVPQGVRYYTDAAALVPVLKIPMIICGPGQAGLAHQPNEYVEVDKLVEAARIFTLAAVRLLT